MADGDGRNGVWLAMRGYSVQAFDLSDVALRKARALGDVRGVDPSQLDLVRSSIEDWQWQADSVDLIVAIFWQFADPMMRSRAMAGMRETLRPGGLLVIEASVHAS